MLLLPRTVRTLCRARDALMNEGESPLSIRSLATELGVSPFQLIRQFEAVFGETPHQYRIQARVERAKQLLVLGELSITEICLEVGFSSLGSFSETFTRRVGESPSRYRRRVKPWVQVPGILPKPIAPGCLTLMGMLPADAFRNFREAPTREAVLPSAHSIHSRGT